MGTNMWHHSCKHYRTFQFSRLLQPNFCCLQSWVIWIWSQRNNLLHLPTYFFVSVAFFLHIKSVEIYFVRVHFMKSSVWQQQTLRPEDWVRWPQVSGRKNKQADFASAPGKAVSVIRHWLLGQANHSWVTLPLSGSQRSVSAAVRASITGQGAQNHVVNSQFVYQSALHKQSSVLGMSLLRVSSAVTSR